MILDGKIGRDDDDLIESLYGDAGAPGIFFGGTTVFLMTVLSETSKLDVNHLNGLKSVTAQFEKLLAHATPPIAPRLDNNSDNQFIAKALFAAAGSAVELGKVSIFQARLGVSVKRAIEGLGKACHGGKGVRPEFKASCDQETILQSHNLMESPSRLKLGSRSILQYKSELLYFWKGQS